MLPYLVISQKVPHLLFPTKSHIGFFLYFVDLIFFRFKSLNMYFWIIEKLYCISIQIKTAFLIFYYLIFNFLPV